MARLDQYADEAGSSIAAPLPRVQDFVPPPPTPQQWVNQTNTGQAVQPWQAEDRTAYISAKQYQLQAEQARAALQAEQDAYQMRQAQRQQFLAAQNEVANYIQRRTGTNPLQVIPRAQQVAGVADRAAQGVFVTDYGYDPSNPATFADAEAKARQEAQRRAQAGLGPEYTRVRYPGDETDLNAALFGAGARALGLPFEAGAKVGEAAGRGAVAASQAVSNIPVVGPAISPIPPLAERAGISPETQRNIGGTAGALAGGLAPGIAAFAAAPPLATTYFAALGATNQQSLDIAYSQGGVSKKDYILGTAMNAAVILPILSPGIRGVSSRVLERIFADAAETGVGKKPWTVEFRTLPADEVSPGASRFHQNEATKTITIANAKPSEMPAMRQFFSEHGIIAGGADVPENAGFGAPKQLPAPREEAPAYYSRENLPQKGEIVWKGEVPYAITSVVTGAQMGVVRGIRLSNRPGEEGQSVDELQGFKPVPRPLHVADLTNVKTTPPPAKPRFGEGPTFPRPVNVAGGLMSRYEPYSSWSPDDGRFGGLADFHVGNHDVSVALTGSADHPAVTLAWKRSGVINYGKQFGAGGGNIRDLVEVGKWLEDLATHNPNVRIRAHAADVELARNYEHMGFDRPQAGPDTPYGQYDPLEVVLNPEKLAKTMARVKRIAGLGKELATGNRANRIAQAFGFKNAREAMAFMQASSGEPARGESTPTTFDQIMQGLGQRGLPPVPEKFQPWARSYARQTGELVGTKEDEEIQNDYYDRADIREEQQIYDHEDLFRHWLDEAGTLQTASNGDRQMAIINGESMIYKRQFLEKLAGRAWTRKLANGMQSRYRKLRPIAEDALLMLGGDAWIKSNRFGGFSLGHGFYGVNYDLDDIFEITDEFKASPEMREVRKLTVWAQPFNIFAASQYAAIEKAAQSGVQDVEKIVRDIADRAGAQTATVLLHEFTHNFRDDGQPADHDEFYAKALTWMVMEARNWVAEESRYFGDMWYGILTGSRAQEFFDDHEYADGISQLVKENTPEYDDDELGDDELGDELAKRSPGNQLGIESSLPRGAPGGAGPPAQPPTGVPAGAPGPGQNAPQLAAGPGMGRAFPRPPELFKPNLELTPQEELELARATAGGMTIRKLGELMAKVDDLLSGATEHRISPVRTMESWFTSEHARLTSPLAMAADNWDRNYKMIKPWSHEVGRVADKLLKPFGKPNDVFKDKDGQPIFFKGENGRVKLTNADVVENYELLASRMTDQQRLAAETVSSFVRYLQNEARRNKIRIGSAYGLDGEEAAGYVHRTVTSVDDKGHRNFANEFGDSSVNRGAGIKISEENPRKHLTRAEGLQAGDKYLNTWTEEYASHVAKLKRREADMALKQTTDRLGQTIGQRVDEMHPGLRQQLADARTEEKISKSLLNQRIRQVNRRAIIAAQKEFTLAKRAVDRAERRMASETIAPKLMGSKREKLVQQVGMAREHLRTATANLKEANAGAIESLKGKRNETEMQILEAARERFETAVATRKATQKATAAARREARADTTREKFQPGGHSIVAGKIFKIRPAEGTYSAQGDVYHLENLKKQPWLPILGDMIQSISQPLRWVMANADISGWFNQGWNAFILDAPAFGKGVMDSLFASISDSYRAKLLRDNADVVQWIHQYAPELWDADPDFEVRGSITQLGVRELERSTPGKVISSVAGWPFRFAESNFRNVRSILAMATVRHFMDPSYTPEQNHELASAILKMGGVARTVGPEKGALFAASFVRSQIGLGMDAITNGGVQGQAARSLFMRLWLKAALATLFYAVAVEGERDKDKLLKKIEPWQPNSFQIAGISLLGPWRPLFWMLSQIGAAGGESVMTGDWSVLGQAMIDQPSQFFRGKLGPVLSKTLNALTGANAIGQPASFQSEFLNPKSFAPLSIQQSIQDIGQGNDPYLAIFSGLTGLRYLPDTPREKMENKLESMGYSQADIDRFWGESNYRKEQIALHPELGAQYDQYEAARRVGSVDQRQQQKIIDDARATVQGKIDKLRSGEGTPVDVKDFVKDQISQIRVLRNALLPGQQSNDSRFAPLYKAYDDAKDPATGEIDFDKASAAQEAYLRDHPELRADWEKQQYITVTNDPAEKSLADARRLINGQVQTKVAGQLQPISYYGSDQLFWDMAKKAAGVTGTAAQLQSPQAYEAWVTKNAGKTSADAADLLAKSPLYKSFTTVRGLFRRQMIVKNPQLGADLAFWYGVNLPSQDLPQETLDQIAQAKKQIAQTVYGR